MRVYNILPYPYIAKELDDPAEFVPFIMDSSYPRWCSMYSFHKGCRKDPCEYEYGVYPYR